MNHGRNCDTPGSFISQYSPQHPALRYASCSQRTGGYFPSPERSDAIAIVAAYHGQMRLPVEYMLPKASPFSRKCRVAATCSALSRPKTWNG